MTPIIYITYSPQGTSPGEVATAYRAHNVRFASCTLSVSLDVWLLGRLPAPIMLLEDRIGMFRWVHGFVPREVKDELEALRAWAPGPDCEFTAGVARVHHVAAHYVGLEWSFRAAPVLDMDALARHIQNRVLL